MTLDSFEASGESSGVGWNWTMAGRTTDFIEKTVPLGYAGRGFTYDWEGTTATSTSVLPRREAASQRTPTVQRIPTSSPGTRDVASHGIGEHDSSAYLWDAALAKGLTVRNYGCFGDGLPLPGFH